MMKKIIIFLVLALACGVNGYNPPIGIPDPSVTWTGVHPIDAQRPTLPIPWTTDVAGFYYVNKDSSNASDVGNGNFNVPRLTIPENLNAGDVVVIQGSYDQRYVLWNVNGTSTDPIWITGLDSLNRFIMVGHDDTSSFVFNQCSYIIVDNFIINGYDSVKVQGAINIFENSHHICFRNGEIKNFASNCSLGASWGLIAVQMSSACDTFETNRCHVFYNLNIEDIGVKSSTWPPDCESGRQGFALNDGIDSIWILDSHIHKVAEDGIHIIMYHGRNDISLKRGPHNGIPSYIWVGRNEIDSCGENAMDIKESNHVIVSQNDFHHFRSTMEHYGWGGGAGQCIVMNDEGYYNVGGNESAANTWILFNYIHDANVGIYCESGNPTYIVGNIITDIFQGLASFTSTNIWIDKSFKDSTQYVDGTVWVVNNTITDFVYGCYCKKAGTTYFENNIWSNLLTQTNYHVRYGTVYINKHASNELFYDPDGIRLYSSPVIDSVMSYPIFIDTNNNNFHLDSMSRAIDRGFTSTVYDTFYERYGESIKYDFDGNVRPYNSTWDIGAFEYNGSHIWPIQHEWFNFDTSLIEGSVVCTTKTIKGRWEIRNLIGEILDSTAIGINKKDTLVKQIESSRLFFRTAR